MAQWTVLDFNVLLFYKINFFGLCKPLSGKPEHLSFFCLLSAPKRLSRHDDLIHHLPLASAYHSYLLLSLCSSFACPDTMGYNKVTKAQKKRVFEKSTGTTTLVDGPQNSHYLKKAKKGEEPVVFLSNNRTLIQRVIPTPLVCEFPVFSPVPSRSDDLDAYDFDDDNAFTTPSSPQKGGMESPSKKRHRATHTAQWESWQLQVIPALVPVFVQLWHRTRGLREADALPAPSKPACDCRSSILCKVSVVRFTGKHPVSGKSRRIADAGAAISDLEIHICECAPAAVQLLRAGLFPSAPWRPSLAVDLRVLEFARNLFGRISPNNTAWTATMESFLRDLGFTLDREVRDLFIKMACIHPEYLSGCIASTVW